MRGYPRYNFDAFENAYTTLVDMGIDVISPHRMDLSRGFDPDKTMEEQGFDLLDCIRMDVDAILKQESIIMLPNWKPSHGATAEYYLAKWAKKRAFQFPELEELYG